MKRIRLHPDFANAVARHGIGMNEIADLSGVSRATLYGLLNPEAHDRRVGGMHRTTAWRLVNTFAEKTGIDPDAAWGMLIIEVEEPRYRKRTRKTSPDATDETTE
jgi:predicted DNA-binding transcriptional regulator AlpA